MTKGNQPNDGIERVEGDFDYLAEDFYHNYNVFLR